MSLMYQLQGAWENFKSDIKKDLSERQSVRAEKAVKGGMRAYDHYYNADHNGSGRTAINDPELAYKDAVKNHLHHFKPEGKEPFINGWNKQHAIRIAEKEERYIAHALTCKVCHNDALPVIGTNRNYQCTQCSNKFSGAVHPY